MAKSQKQPNLDEPKKVEKERVQMPKHNTKSQHTISLENDAVAKWYKLITYLCCDTTSCWSLRTEQRFFK